MTDTELVSAGGGQVGVPPPDVAVPAPSDSKSSSGTVEYELEDGKKVQLTPAEAVARLRRADAKERGADAKFREAAADRERAAYASKVMADFQAAQKNDPQAIRRLATYPELGITTQQAEAMASQIEAGRPGGEGSPEEPQEVGLDKLSPDLQADIKRLRAQGVEEIRSTAFKAVRAALDRDEVVGPIMGHPAAAPAAKRAEAYARGVLQQIAQRALAEGNGSWRPGPQDYEMVAQETRQFLVDMGILGPPADGKSDSVRRTGLPTQGASPLGALVSRHVNAKPPQRVPSTKGEDYYDYLEKRLSHAMALAEGS